MTPGIRILWLAILVPVSGALLTAQHGYGGGAHSSGVGHSSIAPFHMPSAIGMSSPAIGVSTPAYGSHFAGTYPIGSRYPVGSRYPGYSQRSGTYSGSPYGPWRRGSRYGRFAYALPYAYFGAPYFPFFGGPYSDDFDSYNTPGYSGDPQGGPPPDDNGLGEQVQQLSAQISGLQEQLAQSNRPSPLRDDSTPAAPVPPSPSLKVVLNSGQTLEVQNYAVMGDSFWDFSSQPARKIPLSKIDVPASARASEANGAEFPPISSGR